MAEPSVASREVTEAAVVAAGRRAGRLVGRQAGHRQAEAVIEGRNPINETNDGRCN